MPQGANDTLISWGTMDANGSALLTQFLAMIKELKAQGKPGIDDIFNKYGFQTTDWGTGGFKMRKADKTGFIG